MIINIIRRLDVRFYAVCKENELTKSRCHHNHRWTIRRDKLGGGGYIIGLIDIYKSH